jgi:hypothetical protein
MSTSPRLRFSVSLRPDDLAALDAASEQVGMTRAAYAAAVIRAAIERPFDPGGEISAAMKETVVEMRRVGSNLNQVARALNESRAVHDEDIAIVVKQLIEAVAAVRATYAQMIRSRRSNLHIRAELEMDRGGNTLRQNEVGL